MKHAVLLGDPSFFRIKGGLNPYTRNRWGFRKRVDLVKAKDQWRRFKETLESLGAAVHVLPPEKRFPGAVFPANAGFLFPKYEPIAPTQKRFYLSRLAPHRSEEALIYYYFFEELGIKTQIMSYPFEGEADFFPCGDFYIFCFGDIRSAGFRPRWGFPPWFFQYSHRSDRRNLKFLQDLVGPKTVIEARLIRDAYYHGDTCLFAFGRKREYLLAYLPACDTETRERLKKTFGKRLFPLSSQDAENFAANSFQIDSPRGPHILLPMGVSGEVTDRIRSLGFDHTLVDVSEFSSKGGGSVKCLLCDLGPVP